MSSRRRCTAETPDERLAAKLARDNSRRRCTAENVGVSAGEKAMSTGGGGPKSPQSAARVEMVNVADRLPPASHDAKKLKDGGTNERMNDDSPSSKPQQKSVEIIGLEDRLPPTSNGAKALFQGGEAKKEEDSGLDTVSPAASLRSSRVNNSDSLCVNSGSRPGAFAIAGSEAAAARASHEADVESGSAPEEHYLVSAHLVTDEEEKINEEPIIHAQASKSVFWVDFRDRRVRLCLFTLAIVIGVGIAFRDNGSPSITCDVADPSKLGDDTCDGGEYNTEACIWDGGDCIAMNEMNKKYPNCKVSSPWLIGNGRCDFGAFNTKECGWDGEDCVMFNERFPNCTVGSPSWLGDNICHGGEYNTEECGWDLGDCDDFNRKYPNCKVGVVTDNIGDGVCGSEYNIEDCGWDGGDCTDGNKLLKEQGYMNCTGIVPTFIGDGKCQGGEYNTEECKWDGGDCIEFNSLYQNCEVDTPSYIGDGQCDDFGKYNTKECGFDGGDCL